MNWFKGPGPFIILVIMAIFGFIFTFYDIIFEKEWMIIVLSFFGLILVLTIIFIILKYRKKPNTIVTIEEFEKRLEGGLYHFKCPTCKGIFAIKKSKGNNKKPTKMTCPDCGAIGVISSSPCQIEEVIPEKKSVKANFKCNICGEGITIWAEGTDLYKNVNVYSCPFCGEKKPLTRF